MTMPAGTYYVGDLCYCMHDTWDDVCDVVINYDKNSIVDGEFNLPNNGPRFASYSTMYGDGTYMDQEGRSYPVDAGMIGCIAINDISAYERNRSDGLGQIIKFDEDFETSEVDGVIRIGNITIDTN